MEILQRFGQNRNLRDWTSRICNEVLGLCVQTMLYFRGDAINELSGITKQFHHSALLLLREGNPEGREAALCTSGRRRGSSCSSWARQGGRRLVSRA